MLMANSGDGEPTMYPGRTPKILICGVKSIAAFRLAL